MGTSGNRPGFKLYSINTTIRNPVRNDEFLKLFVPFEGKPFDKDAKEKYLAECVKNGVYRFKNLDTVVKNKLDNGIELTPIEVKQSIIDNPQATGLANRVVTQLRSLKDQGFLDFERGGKNSCYRITNIGKLLLNQNLKLSDIYTIAMIGLHGMSPVRKAVYNKTRPFLNTLFVIHELKRRWAKPNRECKGLKLHEFGAFVLSMKDCNYKKAVDEIIKYRDKYGLDENETYLKDYIFNKQNLLKIKYKSLDDYVDDVFRKFEMTGLLRKRGAFNNTYIDFSVENKGKVDQVLDEFGGYYWHEFANKKEYFDFIDSITLPWNKDEVSRSQALQTRADALGVDISIMEGLDNIEKYLDEISGRNALEKQLSKYSVDEIMRELLIISRDLDAEPHRSLAELPESLRLEFLLALLLGAKFGVEHVVSNIHYDEESGEPRSYAGGGQVDISFHSGDLNLIIEATTLKSREQQVNSETSNLSRHLEDMESRTGVRFGMTLVAPYIHHDTCDYFSYIAVRRNVDVCPLTISRIIELLQISETSADFKNNFDLNVYSLRELDSHLDDFLPYVNLKYFAFNSNRDKYSKSLLKVILTKIDDKVANGTFTDIRL